MWKLVLLELREHLNISFSQNKKQSILKISFFALLLVLLTGILYLVNFVFAYLGVFGGMGFIPVPIFNMIFYLIMILITISAIKRFADFVFMSKNNKFLLTLPINSNYVFISKLIVFYILELIREAPVLIPLLISYGILGNMPFYYYLYVLLVFFIIVLLPVALASIISVPYTLISNKLKKDNLVKSLVTLAFLIALTALIFIAINSLPANLQITLKWSTVYFPAIGKFAVSLHKYFVVFNILPILIFNYKSGSPTHIKYLNFGEPTQFLYLFLFLAGCLLVIFLVSLAIKPLFLKLSSYYEEHDSSHKGKHLKVNINKLDKSTPIFELCTNSISRKNALDYLSKSVDYLNQNNVGVDDALDYLNRKIKDAFIRKTLGERKQKFFVMFISNKYVLVENILFNTIYYKDKGDLQLFDYKRNSIATHIYKDILLMVREPSRLVSTYLMFIAAPLAIFFLNAVFNAMNINTISRHIVVALNYLIISLITCSSNIYFASIYSREGKTSILRTTTPQKLWLTVTLPIIVRSTVMILSIIVSVLLCYTKIPVSYTRPDLMTITLIFIYLFHVYFSIEQDYLKPKSEIYNELGEKSSVLNMNELTSFLVGIAISLVFGVITFLLIHENQRTGYINILIVASVLVVAKITFFYLRVHGYKNSIGN